MAVMKEHKAVEAAAAASKRGSAMKQKLIIITGSPCVGKTTVADLLFQSYENSAFFDGDWAWCVNPFSVTDPRLRNGDRGECSFHWLHEPVHPGDIVLNTDGKDPAEIVREMRAIIDAIN